MPLVALSNTALYRNHNIIIYLNCGVQACVTIHRPGHNVRLGLDWPLRKSQWRNSSMTSLFFVLFTDAKNAYEGSFLMVFGKFDPLKLSAIVQTPKKHFLAWLRVIWATVRENPPAPTGGDFSRRVQEKINIKIQNNFGVIFHIFGQTFPYDRLAQFWGYVFVSCT